jgi:Na+/H+-dicarboxylate symporter
MILGLIAGSLLKVFTHKPWVQQYLIGGVFEIGSRIFLSSLKVLVVPLVFVSIVCGTASIHDIKKLGRIGIKTFILYLLTTALAISVAIIVALAFSPGSGLDLHSAITEFTGATAPPLIDVISNIFPSNPIKAFAEGEMLQIIVFAGLFGLALTQSGESGKKISVFFNDLNEVILKLVVILIQLAPFGVFCLMTKTFATQGLSAIVPISKYFFVVLGVLFFHGIIIYSILLKVLSGLSPIQFFKKFRRVPIFAFSTSSSNATIPINLKTTEEELGVSNSIASFAIPLGATINMDGTAIMQGVASVFVAQAYNIPLGLNEYFMVIVTATLASIGTAGVPGVGLVMLTMVFRQVNLPVEGIGLIMGVDRLLDMTRTVVNVTGDSIISCIVAKSEGQLNLDTFNSKNSS